MGEFEWVQKRSSSSCKEEIASQVREFEDILDEAEQHRKTARRVLRVLGAIGIIEYFRSYYQQPPTSFSINISDEIVNRGSPEALTHSDVTLNFGMGEPNKILAIFVVFVGIALIAEIELSHWRISRQSLNQPSGEDVNYQALVEMKQDNEDTLSKSRYLSQGMQLKSWIFGFPLILSLYVLAVLSGNAIFPNLASSGYQIILLDIGIIWFTSSSLLHLAIKLIRVLKMTEEELEDADSSQLWWSLRRNLWSEYEGFFGVLSGPALLSAFFFIYFSGLHRQIWEVFKLWIYVHRSGLS